MEWCYIKDGHKIPAGEFIAKFSSGEICKVSPGEITPVTSLTPDLHIVAWIPMPEEPSKRRWQAKVGEDMWYIDLLGQVNIAEGGMEYGNAASFLGVYKIKDEAEAMAEEIRKFVSSKIGEP